MTRKTYTRRQFLDRAAMGAAAGSIFIVRMNHPAVAWADDVEYTVAPVTNGGTVSGKLTYDGAVPDPIMKEITVDFEVAGTDPRVWEGLAVGDGNGLKDGIVFIQGITSGKDWAGNDGHAYAEHATILARVNLLDWHDKKTKFTVENRDPILHTWQLVTEDGKQVANAAHPAGMPPRKIKVKDPGFYEMHCAPHPWERAFRMATPSPYVAMTGPDGSFSIGDVPAGSYKVTVWAEGITPVELDLTVNGDTDFSPTLTADNLTDALKG